MHSRQVCRDFCGGLVVCHGARGDVTFGVTEKNKGRDGCDEPIDAEIKFSSVEPLQKKWVVDISLNDGCLQSKILTHIPIKKFLKP